MLSYLDLEQQSTKYTDHAANQVIEQISLTSHTVEAATGKQSFAKIVTNSAARTQKVEV